MRQPKEISALLVIVAACEAACIANSVESSNASGQDRVAKMSTECAGESRELRQQMAKNPKASTARFEAASEACIAICEHGGTMSPVRSKCVQACRAAHNACVLLANPTSAQLM
jgi:hypothetical protein